jgi:hypothetical protein
LAVADLEVVPADGETARVVDEERARMGTRPPAKPRRRWWIVVAIVGLVAASAAAIVTWRLTRPTKSEALIEIEAYADAMCACRDETCAKGVEREFVGDEMDPPQRHPPPPESEFERVRAAIERLTACRRELGKPHAPRR